MALLVPRNIPLSEQKNVAEDFLSEAFARDLITMEEFEKRISSVHKSESNRDIQAELEDLPENLRIQIHRAGTESSLNDVTKTNLILSSRTIKGAKLKYRKMKSKLILAEQKLDYSKTVLEPGKYYIDATVVLASLTVIIPENYAVSIDMSTILSEIKEGDSKIPGPDCPEIIIRGKVILGEVKVKVKGSGLIDKIIKLLGS